MYHESGTFAEPEREVTEFEFNSYHRMPSRNHGYLQTRIAGLLDAKYNGEYTILTAVDLDLPTGKAVPDISIYPPMSLDWDSDEIRMTTPPITTIEILSPQQATTDLTNKNNKTYFPAGVKSAWIVLPVFRQINIISHGGKISTFISGMVKDPVTGIELDMADIFR
jgi:Uma2 family endonuclease